jgi:hypothetical protein
MPAYIHYFSAPNFAASLWQNFDSPTDTYLIQSIKLFLLTLKSFKKLFCFFFVSTIFSQRYPNLLVANLYDFWKFMGYYPMLFMQLIQAT